MKIAPCRQFSGEFIIPGDKSITHRAVMFNAAAEGEALVTNALLGEDCRADFRAPIYTAATAAPRCAF